MCWLTNGGDLSLVRLRAPRHPLQHLREPAGGEALQHRREEGRGHRGRGATQDRRGTQNFIQPSYSWKIYRVTPDQGVCLGLKSSQFFSERV